VYGFRDGVLHYVLLRGQVLTSAKVPKRRTPGEQGYRDRSHFASEAAVARAACFLILLFVVLKKSICSKERLQEALNNWQ